MKVIKGVPCVYVSHGEGFKEVITFCHEGVDFLVNYETFKSSYSDYLKSVLTPVIGDKKVKVSLIYLPKEIVCVYINVEEYEK